MILGNFLAQVVAVPSVDVSIKKLPYVKNHVHPVVGISHAPLPIC